MAGELDSGRIEIPCPSCGYKNRKTVGWLKSHKQFTCGGCRERFETSGFQKGMREVDAEIAKLANSLKKGISIKLKF